MPISQLLFSFSGRIPRSTYWLKYFVPYLVIYIVLSIIDGIIGTTTSTGISVIATIFSVIAIYPSLAVAVKRLHDRNRSGWFILLGLIPLVNIWILIEVWFLKGTTGENQYGPDPLGTQAT